jgi:hypothetical protein
MSAPMLSELECFDYRSAYFQPLYRARLPVGVGRSTALGVTPIAALAFRASTAMLQ